MLDHGIFGLMFLFLFYLFFCSKTQLEIGFKKIKKGEKPQPTQPPGLSPAWLPFPAPSP